MRRERGRAHGDVLDARGEHRARALAARDEDGVARPGLDGREVRGLHAQLALAHDEPLVEVGRLPVLDGVGLGLDGGDRHGRRARARGGVRGQRAGVLVDANVRQVGGERRRAAVHDHGGACVCVYVCVCVRERVRERACAERGAW